MRDGIEPCRGVEYPWFNFNPRAQRWSAFLSGWNAERVTNGIDMIGHILGAVALQANTSRKRDTTSRA